METREHQIVSSSPEETLRIGTVLGQYLTSGSIIALNGELGSGKTCLTQGIARGLKVPEGFYVTSPSYSIINEYPGRLALFHVDLYRVEDVNEIEQIGLNEIIGVDGVTVIEWADKITHILPNERLDLSISILDDQTRNLHLRGYGHRAVTVIEKYLAEFGPA
ncbi:MAG: tRNA (N6-adenosine(37)-N6)-threonylcarbamoyltransferase complex ATPase TsaE [Desulfobacterales bacterium S5133MH4]|nr:MAG: tRNA (N6-adenosine(37)-N6)-threonylcarbamoyltransferase complex ATPase TsaE [Desulfobacterales bacterium S5133MH4]